MAAPTGCRVALLAIVLAMVGLSTSVTAPAGCGPEPTVLFVRKGEKRQVSFWSGPTAAQEQELELELGSGDTPPTDEPDVGQPDVGPTPLVVLAGAAASPPPLYDQQPHIVLPEAPQLAYHQLVHHQPADDTHQSADASAQGAAGFGAEPAVGSAAGGAQQSGGGEAAAGQQHAEPDAVAAEASGDGPADAAAAADEDDDGPNQPADVVVLLYDQGSGDAPLSDGLATEEGSGSAALPPVPALHLAAAATPAVATPAVATPPVATTLAGTLTPALGASLEDVTSLVAHIQALVIGDHREADGLDDDELLPLVQHHDSIQQVLSTLQAQEGGDLGASASRRSEVIASLDAGVGDRGEVFADIGPADSLGGARWPTEAAELTEEADVVATADGSGDSEFERESHSAQARQTLDISADDTDVRGSGQYPTDTETILDTDPNAETAKADDDVPATDAVAATSADAADEGAKAQLGAGSVGTPGEKPDRDSLLNGVYRLIQTHNSPNYPVQPVRPVWTGFPGHGPSLPDVMASPLQPYPSHRPTPEVSTHHYEPYPNHRPTHEGISHDYETYPNHRRTQESTAHDYEPYRRPGPRPAQAVITHGSGPYFRFRTGPSRHGGHVIFPGRYRPSRPRPAAVAADDHGATFRRRGEAGHVGESSGTAGPGRPLPGHVSDTSGHGRHGHGDAGKRVRRLDERLLRFIASQPYELQSALLHGRPRPRMVRERRSGGWPDRRPYRRAGHVDCQWKLQTEPHLYLLVTLHNLSAPLTVDCAGAYIEVERENDGFEARWCGNRMKESGSRPHLVFARGEVRIAVHREDASAEQHHLPTGFDADVEVIDLLDARQYATFRRSGLNFRRLIQEPVLPAS